MRSQEHRLYTLLPKIIQQRDAENGYRLQALLQVIGEQVDLIASDIDQRYADWFIETCQDWVVPYIGDLVGYRIVHEAGEPGNSRSARAYLRNKILIPRRDVANTIRNRRRKGTLALLETLCRDAAAWPARAVEFYRLLAWTQHMNHLRPGRAIVDLRSRDDLRRLNGPFDSVMHNVDVRRPNSHHTRGRYNIPSVGLFVWRLQAYSVTFTQARCLDNKPNRFTFSALGHDSPLFTKPQKEKSPESIAGELNVPAPITRQAFAVRPHAYYGPGKSFQILTGTDKDTDPRPIPIEKIVPADLSGWTYHPMPGQVAMDPELGRIKFSSTRSKAHNRKVWVDYHYGLSDRIGGGEYDRELLEPVEPKSVYRVAGGMTINDALLQWIQDAPRHAVIEIADNGIYTEPIRIKLSSGQHLVLRAAIRCRPIIHIMDFQTSQPDSLFVNGEDKSTFMLDGILVYGRGMQVEGNLARLIIRHSILVPGWTLDAHCKPQREIEPSLELDYTPHLKVKIHRSIIGSIQVHQDEVMTDPLSMEICDSIVDATGHDCDDPACEALGAPEWPVAHALLTVKRSTILGRIDLHAIQLGENTIFMGRIKVVRRQIGCLRFCYVRPESTTPRRYRCQPDLVEQAVQQKVASGELSAEDAPQAIRWAQLGVRPLFNATRYGQPAYCQLAFACASEIRRGADDDSEMGVFHDLFQPQRDANLRARLQEYTPAGTDTGVFYVT